MAYEIDFSTQLEKSLARVAREQLERALAALGEQEPAALDQRIHEARKSLKKARALLRLVRPTLPRAAFQAENLRLRDAGRLLSHARDQAAMRECLGRLRELRPSLTASLSRLEAALNAAGSEIIRPERDLEPVRVQLSAALDRLPRLIKRHATLDALTLGLQQSYGRGRSTLDAAVAKPDSDRFHEWRKRAKEQWYHVRLLQNSWPELLGAQIAQLATLSDVLGDEHDLNVVRTRTLERRQALTPFEVETLVLAFDQRIAEQRAVALALGRRLYAERSKAFARRFRAYLAAAGA